MTDVAVKTPTRFCTDPEEEGYWLDVEGELPAQLCGTYFRNGPGSFEIGDQSVSHPFDGAGLVSSIAIKNGRAFFRSRYVETAEWQAEKHHKQPLFRGTFGTQPPGFLANLLDVVPKNAANTNVLLWGDKCWALFEAGQPHRLDPVTLKTLGLDLLGGTLRRGVPFTLGSVRLDKAAERMLNMTRIGQHLPGGVQLGGDALTAHPRVDPVTGNLVMYSYRLRMGPASRPVAMKGPFNFLSDCVNRMRLHTEITFWEFDQNMELIGHSLHSLPGYAFLHDFTVTQHYYVIFRNPVTLSLLPFLLGQKGAVHSVHWDPNQTLAAHLIPRPPATHLCVNTHPSSQPSDSDTNKHSNGSVSFDCQTPASSSSSDSSDNISSSSSYTGHCNHNDNQHHDSGAAGLSEVDWQQQQQEAPLWRQQTSTGGQEMAPHLLRHVSGKSALADQAGRQQTAVPVTDAGSCQDSENGAVKAGPGSRPAVPVQVVQGASGFVFHHANAYETQDGRVIVDAIRYPTLPDFEQACGSGRNFIQDVEPDLQPISQLWRHTLDPVAATMHAHPISTRAMEYPAVNPEFSGQPTQYVYSAAALHPTLNRPQQAIAKTDMLTGESWLWSKHARYYVGEPQFIPRQAAPIVKPLADTHQFGHTAQHDSASVQHVCEDNGWLMALCYDAASHQSELVVLSASDVGAGPVAVLALRKTIPHGLHGGWSEAYTGP